MGRSDTNEVIVRGSPLQEDRPLYPRRHPRVGSQFQTKVPKLFRTSQRPLPQLMSNDFPYVKACDILEENSITDEINLNEESSSLCGHASARGGVQVSRPSEHATRFNLFLQPLFRSIQAPQSDFHTDYPWRQHLIQLHNAEPPGKRSRPPRGGIKRRRANDSEKDIIWSLEGAIQQQLSHQKRHKTSSLNENDAFGSMYLHSIYGGNIEAAEMGVLIELSAGKAKRINHMKRKERADKSRALSPSSSESWRKIYEGMSFPSLSQQLCDKYSSSYSIAVEGAASYGRADATALASDGNDTRGVWRSLLACGKALERKLLNDNLSSKKPLLSTAVSFLSNAYALPTPEACFGTHHVIIEELSTCLLSILGQIEIAQRVQSKMRDMLYDGLKEGVDSGCLIKFLSSEGSSPSLKIDEVETYMKFAEEVSRWERQLSEFLDTPSDTLAVDRNDLRRIEELAQDAKCHGFVSKALVDLQNRIHRAYSLRCRIIEWQHSCHQGQKATPRLVNSLVREATRLKLVFPEVSKLFHFNNKMDTWIERANIAIRSRISLAEIKDLIQAGEMMPLKLSEYLEKLSTRVRVAEEWLSRLSDVVPLSKLEENERDFLPWIDEVRIALADGKYSEIHDLASDGSRIPVEVDAVKVLQVELDAKSWTSKARKWISTYKDSKRGKLEDLREHVQKGICLRDRLILMEHERDLWELEGEAELRSIVDAADSWLEVNASFLVGDNRRSQRRSCLSLQQLKNIVSEGNSIFANLGSATSKISRILAQAEAWYNVNETLLFRCKLVPSAGHDASATFAPLSIKDLSSAVESASSGISIDLAEATALGNLVAKTLKWFEEVTMIAPKRSKRNGRGTRPKFTLADLTRLIEEAAIIPVKTDDEIKRLQMQADAVDVWRSHAKKELVLIANGFDFLRESINAAYGPPKEFEIEKSSTTIECKEDTELGMKTMGTAASIETEQNTCIVTVSEGSHPISDTSPAYAVDPGIGLPNPDGCATPAKGVGDVHRIIRALSDGATETGVMTREAEIVELLQDVSRWCLRSLKYLSTPRDIFDKRFFGAFDRFVGEGQDLCFKFGLDLDKEKEYAISDISVHWCVVLRDQLDRLEILRSERKKFSEWCKVAERAISDEKRLSIERLQQISDQSRNFPAVHDIVHKIRGLASRTKRWADQAGKILRSDQKISMLEAKSLLEVGEKLKVNTSELKTLRLEIRAARGWANRVRRCNLEQGSVDAGSVKGLVEEHKNLLIEMPDEINALQQATQNYCICRRPYEGFMIGCDECDEWYHGRCIGVSESRADRVDKFICIRCSVKNVFKSSAKIAAGVIRKWTSQKDLKKSRQIEYQKHQRKVRKEKKDLQKLRSGILELEEYLSRSGALEHADSSHAGPLHESSSVVESPNLGTSETDPVQSNVLLFNSEEKHDRGEIESKIEDRKKSVEQAELRLKELSEMLKDRKRVQQKENEHSLLLKRWAIRVRSLVLVPSDRRQCDIARPLPNAALSSPMISVLSDASALGISDLPDVSIIENCFKSMSWSLHVLSIIGRKPTLDEVNSILSSVQNLKLPDEKAIRTMKLMVQKSHQIQTKIKKALAPKPGAAKPIAIDFLKELLSSVSDFALHLPEANLLRAIIKDKGARHCVCRWPTDGRFMLCCDKCKMWFHGNCIGIEEQDIQEAWVCVSCSGKGSSSTFASQDWGVQRACYEIDDCVSEHAPDPAALWPPFGLLDSPIAREILDSECCQFPDDKELLALPAVEVEEKRTNHSSLGSPTSRIVAVPTTDSGNLCRDDVASDENSNSETKKCQVHQVERNHLSLPNKAKAQVVSTTTSKKAEELQTVCQAAAVASMTDQGETNCEKILADEESLTPAATVNAVSISRRFTPQSEMKEIDSKAKQKPFHQVRNCEADDPPTPHRTPTEEVEVARKRQDFEVRMIENDTTFTRRLSNDSESEAGHATCAGNDAEHLEGNDDHGRLEEVSKDCDHTDPGTTFVDQSIVTPNLPNTQSIVEEGNGSKT